MKQEVRPEKDGIYIIEVENHCYETDTNMGSRLTYDCYADGRWLYFDLFAPVRILKIVRRVDKDQSIAEAMEEIIKSRQNLQNPDEI